MGWMEICTLLGGLGLFLFGIRMMSEGLELAAGKGLQRLLNKLGGSLLSAVLAGMGMTAVIQSSGATTVTVMGFVNAGLLSLTQAAGAILGANVGATITNLILSLNVNIGVLFAGIGIVLILAGRRDKLRQVGNVFMGLGILFVGMRTMAEVLAVLKDQEALRTLMAQIGTPALGLLTGAALTVILQSGAASVGLLQVLAFAGLITLPEALFLLIGMNLGTSATAFLAASGTSRTARRAAVVQLLFQLIGSAGFVALVLAVPVANFIASLLPGYPQLQIALSHLAFNLGTAIVLLPLTRALEKLAWVFVRGADSQKDSLHMSHFDPRLLATPPIAVSQLFKEVAHMGELASRNFKAAMSCFLEEDLTPARLIQETEDVLDFLDQEVTSYLVEVRAMELGEKDLHLAGSLFHVINDLERIGDHSVNILEAGQERVQEKIKFSPRAQQELTELNARVSHMLDQALHIFTDRITDPDILAGVENEEQAVDDLTAALRDHHVERLKNRKCSARSGMLYLDMLTNLERVADHANNIAGAIHLPHGDSVWIQ